MTLGMTRTRFARLYRMRWLIMVAGFSLIAAACGDGGAATTATTATVAPAHAAGPTETVPETATTTVETTTSTSTTTTEATAVHVEVSDEQLATAAAVGDIQAGEELFNAAVDGVPHSVSCVSCHTLDGIDGRNPSILGISTVAASRIGGMSDIDYLRQSIVDPYAFKVEGEWLSAAMPYQYPNLFSEDQINDLIAFLLTR